LTPRELLDNVVAASEELKALDPVVLDIQGKSTMADYMFICTGTSDVHVRSIVERIEKNLREKGVRIDHVEGLPQATWVLMDYGTVIVNVMQAEQREYYGMEEFWEKMPLVEDIILAVREGT